VKGEQTVSWRRGAAEALRGLGALAVCGLLLVAASPAGAATRASLAPGTASFTISIEVHATSSATFPMADCSGPTALLVPGVTHCLVYRVENRLDVPITVRTLTMRLDPAYPAPPAGCSAAALDLPEYSGALAVPARASAVSPGLPITLTDTDVNQDDCQQTTLHFVYGGSAEVADASGSSATGTLALTGADLPREAAVAVALALLGLAFVVVARRRVRARGTR
jgi:hypothetical protein